jgi:hypothetical protein
VVRVIGGRDPEPPDPVPARAPLAQHVPYTRAWWRALLALLGEEFFGGGARGPRR